MAFKKKGGKPTKKKAKKSGGKKDDWSHEGGMVLDGKDAENNEDGARRKRRLTQDKEESIRRSKLKNNDRKRQKDFRVKMSKKVKFGDVVAAAKAEESDSEESEEEEVVPKFEPRPNPLSVMDRLKVFVSKSLDERAGDRSEEEGSEQEYEEVSDVEGEEYGGDSDEEDEEGVEEEEELVGDDVEEREIRDEDLDSSDELETRRDTSTADFYFDAQFNAEDSGDQQATKMRLLSKIEGTPFDIYGNVNFTKENEEEEGEQDSPLPVAPGPYSTIAQMPGLHKLFRGSAACERIDPRAIDEVNGHMLPYLASYADTFVEGRETSNDNNLLNGMLLHTISHTVKARYIDYFFIA